MRQALAGMLWSKQFYFFDVDKWLEEHGADPLQHADPSDPQPRMVPHGQRPRHLDAGQMGISVVRRLGPGLSHAGAVRPSTSISPSSSSDLLLDSVYLHPTGQIPAYEWNFSDVNPPVQAWAAIFLYRMEQALRGTGDLDFLKRVFGKLSANFGWWVNRKDRFGKNVFEGGFLGLDNIGVFDRSAPLPTGGYLEQADGTAWMALFCQNMLEIAFELAAHDPTYEELASNFAVQFLLIARAMNRIGPGRHVGRRGRLLLRRPAPSRRQRDAAQGPLDGRAAAALRRHRGRQVAARSGSQADGANGGTSCGACRSFARASMPPGRGISASPSAA